MTVLAIMQPLHTSNLMRIFFPPLAFFPQVEYLFFSKNISCEMGTKCSISSKGGDKITSKERFVELYPSF